MPNRDVHLPAGAIVGAGYAAYHAWEFPPVQLLVETAGGAVGGAMGGALPDAIDVSTSPRHRAAAHSMGLTGAVGYFLNERLPEWQAGLRSQGQHYAQLRVASPALLPQVGYGILEFLCYLLSGLLAGLLAGYASHLALDSLTPSSLPILC
jgi:hypothetical protein